MSHYATWSKGPSHKQKDILFPEGLPSPLEFYRHMRRGRRHGGGDWLKEEPLWTRNWATYRREWVRRGPGRPSCYEYGIDFY